MANGKTSTDYWKGQTDAKLEAMSSAVNEIKLTVARVEEKLDAVRLWRAQVLGAAALVAAIVGYIVTLVAR